MRKSTIKKEEQNELEAMNFKRRNDSLVGGMFRMHLYRKNNDDLAIYKIGEGLGWKMFSVKNDGEMMEILSPYHEGFLQGSGMNFDELKELLTEV